MHPPNRANLDLLRRWAVLLDAAFNIPATRIQFGLDALIGLIPGLGDLAAPLFTGFIIATGLRMRVPAVVQARMVLNAALDMLIGLVPFVGDVGDVFWKANLRNMALLERHARPGVRPRRSDYVVVYVAIALVIAIGLVPLALLVWLLSRFSLV